MRCPFCHDNNDKVIDSRSAESGAVIRRRRQCLACGKRFTTYEHVETNTKLSVIKKDGARVPYDRQKMLTGLEKACYKRAVPSDQLSHIVDEVEEEIFRRGGREIQALDIGRMLANKLKQLDQVAYIRFASVYMDFKDIDDLLAEAQEVQAARPVKPLRNQALLFNGGE